MCRVVVHGLSGAGCLQAFLGSQKASKLASDLCWDGAAPRTNIAPSPQACICAATVAKPPVDTPGDRRSPVEAAEPAHRAAVRTPRPRATTTASQKHGGSDRPACEPASWRGADLPGAHRRKPASCRSRPRGAIGACRAALTRPRHEVSTVPRLSLPSARPLSGPLPGRRGRAAGPRVSRHGACRVAVKKKALF